MNKYFKLIFSLIVTIICIFIAFKGENYTSLFNHIKNIKKTFLVFSILILVFSCYIRALRWSYILSKNSFNNMHSLFGSVMVGYFGNNVLPFRLGEVLRSYSATFYCNISFTRAIASVVLERIMDLGFVIIMFFLISPWFPVAVYDIVLGIGILSAIIICFFLMIGLNRYFGFLDILKNYKIFSNDLSEKFINTIEAFLNSISSIKESDYNIQIILLSIVLWIFYYLATYFILLSFSLDLDFVSIWLIIIISSIAIGIPALPGAIGTYEAGVKFAMISLLGVASEKALAFALISHAASFVPFTVLGAVYFFIDSVRLSDIKDKDVIG